MRFKEREIITSEEKSMNVTNWTGDNLESLYVLQITTHKGLISLIYIDPPYNLGGDFSILYD